MLIFGAYSLFLRFFPAIPTITFLFAFQIVGAVGFFFLARGKLSLNHIKNDKFLIALLFSLAVFSLANNLSYFLALRLTSVANATIAHQMVSVFLLILAPWLVGEKTRRNEFIALAISLLGIAFLYGQGVRFNNPTDLLGISLGVASALFYALLIILYRNLPQRGIPTETVNFWGYAISALILLPFMPALGGFAISTQDILPLILFGFIFAVLAVWIHTSGISQTRPLHASIIGKSEPVIASFYAFIFLSESPSFWVLVGGVMIIGASLWLAFDKNNSISQASTVE